MFLDEAKLIAGIRHPNVVQVQELSEDGDYFLVMEYLAGESVSSFMKRLALKKKRVPYAVSAFIIAEACGGLHAAHELRGNDGQLRNVVHRDISPQNIFITYDGAVKVIDFGIAKATDRNTKTEAGQLKGKFAYMAPESCRGGRIDRRTDLFSLATVLYEISTGVRLFRRSTDMKTLEAVCYEPIRKPSQVLKDYPPELEAIVMRGLEREPEKRYQTAAEMRRDLVRVAHSMSQGGLPEEQLNNAMHSLFADRLTEKQDMLRRVRSGARLEHIPTGEIESEVSIPVVIDEKTGGVTGPSMTGMRPVSNMTRGEKIKAWLESQEIWKLTALGAAGAFILLTLLMVIGTVLRSGSDADDPVPPSGAASSPNSAAGGGDEAVHPSTVELTVATAPSGANVVVDGVYRGVTPTVVKLPYSEGPVALELTLPGFQTMTEAVVPNGNQKLEFSFESEGSGSTRTERRPSSGARRTPSRPAASTPKPSPNAKPAPAPKPATKPAGGGFEAFD